MKALVSYAEMLNANERGDKEFTTTITYEVDGITNGPFNASIFMGLSNLSPEELLTAARGGLFTDGTKDYRDWIF